MRKSTQLIYCDQCNEFIGERFIDTITLRRKANYAEYFCSTDCLIDYLQPNPNCDRL